MLISLKTSFLWNQVVKNKFKEQLKTSLIESSKIELRISKKDRKEANLGDDFYTFLIDKDLISYKKL